MSLQGANIWQTIIITIFFTLLSACGGGSTDEAPSETSNLTYQPLPTTLQVDEGTSVNLTLALTGDGAEQIKFNWQVGNDIVFTGQGTDSISFSAPNVKQLETIHIQVTLDSSSKVIGFNDQSTSIIVENLVTFAESGNIIEESVLPQVDALNFDSLITGSTWFHEQVHFSHITNDDGSAIKIGTRMLNLLHIESTNVSTETITLAQCGLTGTHNINIQNYAEENDCGNEVSSLNIKQAGNEFRLEHLCGDTVVTTDTYIKKSDERLVSNGELNVDFSSYQDIASTTQVCGVVATSDVKSYDSNETLIGAAQASVIRLFTEYQGNPFELQFLLDSHPTDLLASLHTGFSSENVAKIYTDVLPEISNLAGSDSGLIQFDFHNDEKNIIADFDFSLSSTGGHKETISGQFSLLFESTL